MNKKINPKTIFVCFAIFTLAISFFNLAIYSYKKHISTDLTPEASTDIEWGKIAIYDEIEYWQDFLKDNSEYVPGWVTLANLQLKINDVEGAKYSLETAKRINPFYEEIAKTAEKLKLLSSAK